MKLNKIIQFFRKRKTNNLLKNCEVLHGSPTIEKKGHLFDLSEKLGDIKIVDANGEIMDVTLKEKYRFQRMIDLISKEKFDYENRKEN